MEDEVVRHRNWLLYTSIALGALCAILGVAGTIIWIDRQNAIEDRNRLALAASTDQWARYDQSLASCERGNTLRLQINEYATGFDAVNELLVQFFDSSAQFRRASGQPELAKEAVAARETIQQVADNVRPVPLVDCSITVVVPPTSRPTEGP